LILPLRRNLAQHEKKLKSTIRKFQTAKKPPDYPCALIAHTSQLGNTFKKTSQAFLSSHIILFPELTPHMDATS
jgi:hypothetical protein